MQPVNDRINIFRVTVSNGAENTSHQQHQQHRFHICAAHNKILPSFLPDKTSHSIGRNIEQ
jgi:hypothetical protein